MYMCTSLIFNWLLINLSKIMHKFHYEIIYIYTNKMIAYYGALFVVWFTALKFVNYSFYFLI